MYVIVHFTSSSPDLFSSVLLENLFNDLWCLSLYFPQEQTWGQDLSASGLFVEVIKGVSVVEWRCVRGEMVASNRCFIKSVTSVGNCSLSPLGRPGSQGKCHALMLSRRHGEAITVFIHKRLLTTAEATPGALNQLELHWNFPSGPWAPGHILTAWESHHAKEDRLEQLAIGWRWVWALTALTTHSISFALLFDEIATIWKTQY